MNNVTLEILKKLTNEGTADFFIEIRMSDFEEITSKYIEAELGEKVELIWNADEETGFLYVSFNEGMLSDEHYDKLSDMSIHTDEWYDTAKTIIERTFGLPDSKSSIYVSLDMVNEMKWKDVYVPIPLTMELIGLLAK